MMTLSTTFPYAIGRWSLLALAFSVSQFLTALALACSFHIALPELSIGDRIIDASHIVLARENRDRPFTFEPVISLKGDAADLEIPLLVDSTTRRRLKLNPGDSVLISRSSMDGEWNRLAYIREQDRVIFEEMVAASDSWQKQQDALSRFRFFTALHDHSQSSIRKIALTELDKIPYNYLRTMQVRLPAEEINAKLLDRYEMPWVPIRILMMGILGNDESRVIIENAIGYIEKSGFERNLGAWATAYIEVAGQDAIDRLSQKYLLNQDATANSVELVLTAFAVHGTVDNPKLKSAIDSNLERSLAANPELAVQIARIFGAQQDYSQFTLLLKSMKSGALRTPHGLLIVASYLSLAQKANESTE